jgi:hypothetical protein
VDTVVTRLKEYMKSWNYIHDHQSLYGTCDCQLHRINVDTGKTHARTIRTVSDLLDFVQCAKTTNDDIKVRRQDQYAVTEEDQQRIIAKKAHQVFIKKDSSKSAIRVPSRQSVALTSYPYNCSHHMCNSCGIDARWNPLLSNCSLIENSKKLVTLKMFMKIRRSPDSVPVICSPSESTATKKSNHPREGNKEKHPQDKVHSAIELVSISLSLEKFFIEGANLLQNAMPHMANVRCDNFNSKLFLEGSISFEYTRDND